MRQVLVAGAGKIGALIGQLLALTPDYQVHLADVKFKSADSIDSKDPPSLSRIELDATDRGALTHYLQNKKVDALISCLPYYCNEVVAQTARQCAVHYFDLTEDVGVSATIQALAASATTVFVPQCGLAPGFVSIVANDLMQHFDEIKVVAMRVGALPAYSNNALKYALTWSTDGLINEYGNPCWGIVGGKSVQLQPLEGLETINIEGHLYEAFNTSGGLGSLAASCLGKVDSMNYKTLRNIGHCEKMRFLMQDLKLNEDRVTLKQILEKALPTTQQDVVLMYVCVQGYRQNEFVEEVFVKKIYPSMIGDKLWSAIQVATSTSVCAVFDIIMQNLAKFKGFIPQESISLDEFKKNRFGQYYL